MELNLGLRYDEDDLFFSKVAFVQTFFTKHCLRWPFVIVGLAPHAVIKFPMAIFQIVAGFLVGMALLIPAAFGFHRSLCIDAWMNGVGFGFAQILFFCANLASLSAAGICLGSVYNSM
jgi:hypothetical protein